MKKMASLHTHSQRSPLDSIATFTEYVAHAPKVGITAVSATDHGRTTGHRELQRAVRGTDIKAILGLEGYFSPTDRFDRRSKQARKDGTSVYDHLVIHAMNENGLKNLNAMNTEAWNSGFYHMPRVDKELLEQYNEDLIVTSACISGPIAKMLREDQPGGANEEEAYERASWFQKVFGDRFYIELMADNDPDLNHKLLLLADTLGIKPIVTEDCHYVTKDDLWIEEAFLILSTNQKRIQGRSILDDQIKNKSFVEKYNYIWGKERPMTFQEFSIYMAGRDLREVQFADQGIDRKDIFENTLEIADRIGEYPYFENLNLLPTPKQQDPQKRLEQLAREGLSARGMTTKEDKERLEYELDIIKQKGFASYFLIVSYMLKFCRKNKIRVGFGRGSAAGSLVCYSLRITEINPMEEGLIFERFLDLDRTDWPDVDVDVQHSRRAEVKAELARQFGYVASIATKNMFKEKNSLKDAANVLGIPFSEANKAVKDLDPENAFDKYLQSPFHKKYPDVYKLASKFEGKIKNTGMHAGGLVVSREPIQHYVPMETANGGKDLPRIPIIGYDMGETEEIGFIKMDFLGLKDWTIVDDCLAIIEEKTGKYIDHLEIPVDDPAVLKMLSDGYTEGVSQAQGHAFTKWILDTGVSSFKDLVIGTSIARPGPMTTIGEIYKRRLRGEEVVTYDHSVMEQHLKETLGVIVYQEQLMFMIRDLAGMSMKEANQVRRVVAKKKDPKLLKEFKEKFIAGASEKVSKERAEQLWHDVEAHSGYSFNKSHAVAYSRQTNVMAWLKYYYPQYFMYALLKNEEDKDRTTDFLIEAKRLGVKVLLPDVNKSGPNYTIEGDGIRIGLGNVKYISEATSKPIIVNRPYRNFDHFKRVSETKKSGINKRAVDSLVAINAFKDFTDNPSPDDWRSNLYEYVGIPSKAVNNLPPKVTLQMTTALDYDEEEPNVFMGMVRSIKMTDTWGRIEMLDGETGVVSCFIKPDEQIEKGKTYVTVSDKSMYDYIEVDDLKPSSTSPIAKYLKIGAPMAEEDEYFILAVKSRKTKAGATMATVVFADWHKKLYKCTVWPSDWITVYSKVKPGTFVKLMTELNDKGDRFFKGIKSA